MSSSAVADTPMLYCQRVEVTPKAVVVQHLKQRGLTQADIAKQLGISSGALSMALNKVLLNPQGRWSEIFDTLGLEVVIRPKREGPL